MFKNKHMTTAMIVAPLLAIGSYFATDYIVSDIPEVAEEGKTYSMVARSNCRYESGECTFKNGDVEIDIRLSELENGTAVLLARSSHPLKGAQAALIDEHQNGQAREFVRTDKNGAEWQLPITGNIGQKTELRIAMVSNNNTFYGSTETTFFQYDTIFSRESWQ